MKNASRIFSTLRYAAYKRVGVRLQAFILQGIECFCVVLKEQSSFLG